MSKVSEVSKQLYKIKVLRTPKSHPMKFGKSIATLIFAALLASCSNNNTGSSEMPVAGEKAMELTLPVPIITLETSRKLIRTADLTFKTNDLGSTRQRINASVKKNNAWISSETETTSGRTISRNITIRVPSENLDLLIGEINEGIESVDYLNISSNDVTEEYLDAETRLRNRKALETRYLELLSKASSMSEVLQIENQINQLRTEVESIEGRMKYLSDRIAYSTLNLSYYKTESVQSHLGEKLIKGLKNGWTSVLYILIIIANVWPLLLLGLLVAVVIMIYRRSRNKRML